MKEDREFNLRVIMLLSALESWGFSTERPIPNFLHNELSSVVDELRGRILIEAKND